MWTLHICQIDPFVSLLKIYLQFSHDTHVHTLKEKNKQKINFTPIEREKLGFSVF